MNGISLEIAELDQRYQRRLAEHCSAEDLFERRWIESLLAHVLQLLRQDYDKAGKPEFFNLLSEYLVATGNRLPQAEIAQKLGISVSAVAMSLQRMRKRYVALLRQELGRTVLNPADIDDELMKLKATMVTTSCVGYTLSE
jgi:biotin operon repressor